jgi:conjugal transfer/entry exclusion protein
MDYDDVKNARIFIVFVILILIIFVMLMATQPRIGTAFSNIVTQL